MARKSSLPLAEVYQLIEPGPVVLVTTAEAGRTNIMTMSWHMMIDFEPPLIACVIGNRGYTFEVLKRTRECVINIPTVEFSEKIVACGNISGRGIDKFEKFGFTPCAGSCVQAPLIAECYANLECRVTDIRMETKYNIFIIEVVNAWIDRSNKAPRTLHHQGYGKFTVDGNILILPPKMR